MLLGRGAALMINEPVEESQSKVDNYESQTRCLEVLVDFLKHDKESYFEMVKYMRDFLHDGRQVIHGMLEYFADRDGNQVVRLSE